MGNTYRELVGKAIEVNAAVYTGWQAGEPLISPAHVDAYLRKFISATKPGDRAAWLATAIALTQATPAQFVALCQDLVYDDGAPDALLSAANTYYSTRYGEHVVALLEALFSAVML